MEKRRSILTLLATSSLLAAAVVLATSTLATSGCQPESSCDVSSPVTRCAGLDLQKCTRDDDDDASDWNWEDVGLCGADCTGESCPAGPVSLCITNPQGIGFCAVSPTVVPECAMGASSTCWQNDLVTCDASGYVATVDMPCGSLTCVDDVLAGGAFCAASPTPIPDCVSGNAKACWENQIVDCHPSGYALAIDEVCDDRTCVDTAGCGPLCVLGADPLPACTPTTASVCIDGTPTDCQCGYGVATRPSCGAPELCETRPVSIGGAAETEAFCVLSATPYPGCSSTGRYTLCDGTTLVTCEEGFPISETPCPAQCHAYGGQGSCG